jgi:Mce-associated membrane protein
MSDTDELTTPVTEPETESGTALDTESATALGTEATGSGAVEETAPPEPRAGRLRAGLGLLRTPAVLLVVAVLLVLLGGWWQWRAAALRGAPEVTNRALVDTAATTQVLGDVSDDLNRVFSYSYTDTASTEQAASQVLAGAAAGQYRTLFAQVENSAAAQQLTVTTRTVAAGVTSLSGDDADLVVFLDQSAKRGDTGATSTSAAELAVTAHRTAGHWQITGLQAR